MNIIKHITDNMPRVEQVVVEYNGNHYLISSEGPSARYVETLAYMCEPGGKVLDGIPVAGSYDRTIAEVMVNIIQGNMCMDFDKVKFHGF
jgi:hypothetical protein